MDNSTTAAKLDIVSKACCDPVNIGCKNTDCEVEQYFMIQDKTTGFRKQIRRFICEKCFRKLSLLKH